VDRVEAQRAVLDRYASPDSPALTSEQLSRVREIAYEKGRQLKLSEDGCRTAPRQGPSSARALAE
jgi:hypothetical protein